MSVQMNQFDARVATGEFKEPFRKATDAEREGRPELVAFKLRDGVPHTAVVVLTEEDMERRAQFSMRQAESLAERQRGQVARGQEDSLAQISRRLPVGTRETDLFQKIVEIETAQMQQAESLAERRRDQLAMQQADSLAQVSRRLSVQVRETDLFQETLESETT